MFRSHYRLHIYNEKHSNQTFNLEMYSFKTFKQRNMDACFVSCTAPILPVAQSVQTNLYTFRFALLFLLLTWP